jgi:hypothetical protein
LISAGNKVHQIAFTGYFAIIGQPNMFIFRWISNIVAPIGFIIILILAFFALKPLDATPQPKLDLAKILNCQNQFSATANGLLSDEEILNIKSQIGTAMPVEIINQFTFGNVVDSLLDGMGSKSELDITYCTMQGDSTKIIPVVENYLESQNKYYIHGSVDQFVDRINTLPFAKISNIDLELPSIFARTNYCSQSINKSELYLFAVVPGPQSNNLVAMFNMSFIEDDAAENINRYTGNILKTTQYFKAKLNCK